MSVFRKVKWFIKQKHKMKILLPILPVFRVLPDKLYLKSLFKHTFDEKLNLDEPQTYNEKLQWLKLYDRNPQYSIMVDKFEVKKYVAEKIGEEYIVPNYGVWERFDDIDFDILPEQFVLKCTHDCGGLVICKDKKNLDMEAARKKINRCLKRNYFWSGREWPYKSVKPRIIAEAYIEDEKTKDLPDYKFFAFNGEVKAMFIATERQSAEETKFDFFDADFCHLPFINGHPNVQESLQKPKNFKKMKLLAETLSKNIPQVRIDFYEVNGRIYFGEITLFHWSGLVPFEPEEWDKKFGDWIQLPDKKAEK